MTIMEPMQDVHMAKPGLLVVEAAAADEETALAFEQLVAGRWAPAAADEETVLAFERAVAGRQATTDAHRMPKMPGQSGVWLRFFLDLRQELGSQA
jgi:hypothetical protein